MSAADGTCPPFVERAHTPVACACYNRTPAPTPVLADNKQANTICAEDLVTQGNMYFRTTYHYNKEMVRDGFVTVQYVHTSKNIADACTKSLAAVKIGEFEPILNGYKQTGEE